MTITIKLPPAKLELLQAEAAATGKDVETVVRDAVDARLARRQQTFAGVLKPIHDAVAASGMTPEEALKTATSTAAELLGKANELGAVASGYFGAPICCHQRRTVATANSAVSWSVPTLTHPSLAPTS